MYVVLVLVGLLCARSLYTSARLIQVHGQQLTAARKEPDEQDRRDETEISLGKLLFRIFRLYTSGSGLVLVLLAPFQPASHHTASFYGDAATAWIISLEVGLTFINEFEAWTLHLVWPYRKR